MEHKCKLTQGLLEESKLTQRAYKEGCSMCWKEVKNLQIALNISCRKYKESAHMALLDYPINQPSLDISAI